MECYDIRSGSTGYKWENRNRPLAAEMCYQRRSWRRKRLARIRNKTIREVIEMEKDITHEVHKPQVMWAGHTNRVEDMRWPRNILEWVPEEKSKGGRPRRGWRDDVKEAMEARGFAEEDC
jgi:hypothetical protein